MSTPRSTAKAPRADAAGFLTNLSSDATSGFLVSLIALPLCLGIALASGFPAVAGVITAVVGGVVATAITSSELTIKGPAAGLIVIVLGAMNAFGFTGGHNPQADLQAYRMTLAVGCAAGLVQVVLALLRVGVLGEFFPTAVVHGMLAAIGLTILIKQLPVVFGEAPGGEPLEVLLHLPDTIMGVNPQIALIGSVSLAILFLFPLVRPRLAPAWLRLLPPQLLVLAVAVPLGIWFDLAHEHTYSFLGHGYRVGESFLVNVPANLLAAVTYPDFSVFTAPATRLAACWWVVLFAVVGSLESLLSAKAIDLIDPWRRQSDASRDLLAVGIANAAAASIGGLPMISEIVRSKANVEAGGCTRFANLWHGVFLLAFVALAPQAIHRIPLAALAAMLVYTGYRLASPREFINVYRIGTEQLLIFVATILGVLATDLLAGVGIGIALKFAIHAINGVPLSSFFMPFLTVTALDDRTVQIDAAGSAVFSNWIPFRRQIVRLGLMEGCDVIVNLAGTRVVDHSVMEKLEELGHEFEQAGRRLEVIGLDAHRGTSRHPHATRVRVMTRLRRVTVVAEAAVEEPLVARIRGLGASGYTAIGGRGGGRRGDDRRENFVRIEAIVPDDVARRILEAIRVEFPPPGRVTACVETVEVLVPDAF